MTCDNLDTDRGQLNYPTGIASYQYEVYVADRKNHRISVFQSNGKFCRVIGQEQLSAYFDITVNTNCEILAADWGVGHHCIYIFKSNGDYINNVTVGKGTVVNLDLVVSPLMQMNLFS